MTLFPAFIKLYHNRDLYGNLASLITASLDRLGQGEFVSLMGKTRPLVKSLGIVTYEEEDTGYGRCLLILF